MIAEIIKRCETVEECYEFMLGYAAQRLPSDAGRPEIREFLQRAVDAVARLADDCLAAAKRPEAVEHCRILARFLTVVRRDASDSVAALQLVLAQPSISSQLIDNLNASIHLRALLTDLFLLGDILRNQSIAGATATDSIDAATVFV